MPATHLLDTSVYSQRLKPQPHVQRHRPLGHPRRFASGDLHRMRSRSAFRHCQKGVSAPGRRYSPRKLRPRLAILPFDSACAAAYADLRAACEHKGSPVTDMDLLIAATAKASGLMLATLNIRHFKRHPRPDRRRLVANLTAMKPHKPVKSFKHKDAKRAHIPSAEEAGYEADSAKVEAGRCKVHCRSIPSSPAARTRSSSGCTSTRPMKRSTAQLDELQAKLKAERHRRRAHRARNSPRHHHASLRTDRTTNPCAVDIRSLYRHEHIAPGNAHQGPVPPRAPRGASAGRAVLRRTNSSATPSATTNSTRSPTTTPTPTAGPTASSRATACSS